MNLTLRPVTLPDAAQVARIYAHYVTTSTATFDLTPPAEDAWATRIDDLRGIGWPFLAADLGGAVAGFAYVAPWRPRPAYAQTVEDTIYLDPRMVGRGIGTKLLDQVLAEAKSAGAREVIAVIADGDTTASSALHRRAGFADAGRLERVGRKFDRWLGTTLLQKSLT